MSEEITVLDPNFQLALSSFEGPLDLLLHLIKAHELDILDLPIAFVAKRYVEYISLMEALNLDVAAEYLVMAATLAHIKSRFLLPDDPSETSEEEEELGDPRAMLIARLLDYQRYKQASETLRELPWLGRDTFSAQVRDTSSLILEAATESESSTGLRGASPFALAEAFQAVLLRSKGRESLHIDRERITIQARMRELVDRLQDQSRLHFEELFEEDLDIYGVVVTFLALLELTKMKLVSLKQLDYRTPLVVSLMGPVAIDDLELSSSFDEAAALPA